MSKSEQKKQYIPSSGKTWAWLEMVNTHNNNNGGHNKKCAIDYSMSCSKEMADDVPSEMKPLCLWHRVRMAQYKILKCGCKNNDICTGDGLGRQMFRLYHHNSWNMAVGDDIDIYTAVGDYIGIYCCGLCQNANTGTHMCGEMKVCPNHMKDHDSKTLVEIENSE